jgi:hypothetical protein
VYTHLLPVCSELRSPHLSRPTTPRDVAPVCVCVCVRMCSVYMYVNGLGVCVYMYVYVCVRVYMCATHPLLLLLQREKEKEKECVCVCSCERERKSACMCATHPRLLFFQCRLYVRNASSESSFLRDERVRHFVHAHTHVLFHTAVARLARAQFNICCFVNGQLCRLYSACVRLS